MKRTSFLALSLALVLAAAPAGARNWTVDLRAPASALAPTEAKRGGGDTEFLRAAEAPETAAPALAPGDALTLLLFDGETVDIEIVEASASTISGSRAFLARSAGSPFLNAVVLVDADGRLHASVSGYGEGNVLRVFPRGGATAVVEAEPVPIVDDTPPAVPAPEAAPAADGGGDAPLPAATQQSDTIVDVLVGYELGAKDWAEHNGGATNFAEKAVQRMNVALANSDLDGYYRFRLVGVMFFDERETDLYKALKHCGFGEWEVAMQAARDACGADVVSVLVDTGASSGTCGLGNPLTATNAASAAYFRNSAYNVCAIRAVAQSDTMTHEVGHNLGCGHSPEPTAVQPGPQGFPYSSGYHFTGSDGTRYHTIMAYDWLDGVGYRAAPVFSSPLLTFAGVPAGTAESNDNRRVLTQTGAWASNWREAVVPLNYDVFFTPATETPIDGSLVVTLEPGRSGLPIRYTLDGTAPTLSSPLYSGPITLTATTTIRAATVYQGRLGPVCTARYFVPDLAEALDTPGLVWTTGSYSPFTFETAGTWDGTDAVRSCTNSFSYAYLEARISGPTRMSFRFRTNLRQIAWNNTDNAEALTVAVDGTEVWSASPAVQPSPWDLGEVSIPSGSHTVRFHHASLGLGVYALVGPVFAVWLDDVRFDALSRPPVLSPSTTDDEATARTFANGSQTVSISAPGGEGTTIWYTTDGSDPETDGIPYEGPFTVTASTRVRAIAVTPGLDRSVETAGLYLERHRPVLPGEWTADVDGLRTAASNASARLILGLYNQSAANSDCAAFRLVAEDPAFTSWCAANGVYLLRSDTTVYPDGVLAKSAIFDWYGGSTMYGPMLVAVTPDGETLKAKYAVLTSGSTFGTKTYRGTVDSLVDCIAAIIGSTPPSAPTATPDGELVDGYPVSVALANPNSSGTLRYTLDGSAPTRSSAAYAGSALQIQRGQILSAAVFPASSSDLTSPVLVRNYRTVADFFGIPADAFDWSTAPAGSAAPWRIYPTAGGPVLRSGHLDRYTQNPYSSSVRSVARAAGRIAFSLGDTTMNDAATTVFTAPDGTRTVVSGSDESVIEWRTFSVGVKPGDVLLWSREVTTPTWEDDEVVIVFAGSCYPGAFLSKVSWTPSGDPPELGTVSVAATATGATVSVLVSALGEGSSSVTVTVSVAGAEQTQTLDAAGTATFVFSGLEPGTPYTASVTATGSNGGIATASSAFSTEALPSVGWFDVKWGSQGWGSGTAWRTAAGEAAAGGAWTVPAGDASARSGSVLELGLPEGAELRFTAASPSAAGGFVTVEGTLEPVVARTPPDLPSGAFAALCFVRGGYRAWNGAQWISLAGAAPAASATPWSATFDFSSSPPRVRYSAGGATLSASGSSWIPLASAPVFVRGVGYAGGGAVGDFKATYAGGIPVPVLATGNGAEPLVFGGTDSAPTLTITIGNAKAGVWYAVYASETVNGDYAFVQRAHPTKDGTLPFTIDATAATKFIRIKASDEEIAPSDPLFPAAP